MGQMSERCSCLFHKDNRNVTAKFEPCEENPTENINEVIPVDNHLTSNEFNNNLMTSKTLLKTNPPSRGLLQDQEDVEQSSPTFQQSGNIKQRRKTLPAQHMTFQSNKSLKKETSKTDRMLMIQKVLRGVIFRKRFRTIKVQLANQMNNMLKDLNNKINSNVKRAESLMGRKFDKEAWIKLEVEEMKKCQYDYGRTYQTKLKVISVGYYSGSVNSKNEMHGYGICYYNNGSKYEGHWRNNCFTGWGRIIDRDGVLIEGIFENELLNGNGIKRSLNDSIYEGDFLNSLKHGTGREETKEHKYIGEYKLDKRDGKGRLEYKILKDTYEGEFKDNQITGYGFYTWANHDTYEGVFLNGKMHGKGRYKWPDGGEYFGEYINNIKEGNGVFKWSNGKTYEGPFKNGRPNGFGKVKHNDKVIEVEFRDGRLVGNPNQNQHQVASEGGNAKKKNDAQSTS